MKKSSLVILQKRLHKALIERKAIVISNTGGEMLKESLHIYNEHEFDALIGNHGRILDEQTIGWEKHEPIKAGIWGLDAITGGDKKKDTIFAFYVRTRLKLYRCRNISEVSALLVTLKLKTKQDLLDDRISNLRYTLREAMRKEKDAHKKKPNRLKAA